MRLHATTDAQVWAKEFIGVASAKVAAGESVLDLLDEGWLIGWFANAIETGRGAGMDVVLINEGLEGDTEPPPHDDKYVVFKRPDFNRWWSQGSVGGTEHRVPAPSALDDAVVIRRQDLFAGPALAAYAACIAMVARANNDAGLQAVADYFHQQSVAAGEEGWKLPDG